MRPLISLMLLAVLIVLPVAVKAQESPSPFPPDPAILFAEGVEVVSVEIEALQMTADQRPKADNEARMVRVLDRTTDQWREYPYPDEVEAFTGRVDSYDANTLLLATSLGRGVYGNDPDPNGQWLLDLSDGTYSRAEVICDTLRPAEGKGYWVIYNQPNDGQSPELCNVETGERLTLDLDVTNLDYDYRESANRSPDNTKALFNWFDGYYVYTFADQSLVKIGSTRSTDIEYGWWLGNDTVMIYETDTADMSFPWQFYSLGDANVADSLHPISTVYKPDYITQLENPTRYEWVDYREDGNCDLVQIHTETGQIDRYDLQDLCDQGKPLNAAGDRLYTKMIVGETEDGQPAPLGHTLIVYNPLTGERREVISGEIEYVIGVSADGRYATLVTDDTGYVDMIHESQAQSALYRETRPDRPIQLALVDLQSGDMLYTTSAHWLDTQFLAVFYPVFAPERGQIGNGRLSHYAGGPYGNIFDIAPGRFLAVTPDEDFTWKHTLLEVKDDELQATNVGSVLLVTPDADRLIVWDSLDGERGTVSSFNLVTRKMTPLIEDSAYDIRNWMDQPGIMVEDEIVRVQQADAPDEVAFSVFDDATKQTAIYTIRLP